VNGTPDGRIVPRSSAPAVAIVNTLLIPLGAVCVAAGVVGASRYGEMRWAFVLFAIGGVVVLAGAVHGVFAWGRAVQVDEATEREMVAAVREQPRASTGLAGPVLAHWTYTPEEWGRYAASEIRFRSREALWMGLGALLLGTLVLGLLEGEWGLAAAVSGAVGGFIALGRWLMAFFAWRRHRAVPTGDVVIGTTAILVNRRYEVVHDRRVRFGGARVLEGARPAVLEVTIMVPGKYRRVAEEYRIPIPSGREDEARSVAAALASAHG
jgi:hypothetical protein